MQNAKQISNEPTLSDYWTIVKKNKLWIISLVLVCVLTTAVSSLFMDNIYEASAVITPASDMKDKMGGLTAMASQFGGIAGLAGVALPGSSSLYEIDSLLNSNTIREKVIVQNNLLPVLFDDDWDAEKKHWKQPSFIAKLRKDAVKKVKSLMPAKKTARKDEDSDSPTVWDGIRELDERIISVNRNQKSNLITITAEFHDPEMAAQIVDYFLIALMDHMSAEAKRVANTNRTYLEEQLRKAVDPTVRQKMYDLLTRQVETALMAEVKENFAFKVLDPPKAPDKKIKPRRSLMVLASLFVSSFIGIFIAVFREGRVNSKAGESLEVEKVGG